MSLIGNLLRSTSARPAAKVDADAEAAGKYHARDASYHFLNRCLPVNSR